LRQGGKKKKKRVEGNSESTTWRKGRRKKGTTASLRDIQGKGGKEKKEGEIADCPLPATKKKRGNKAQKGPSHQHPWPLNADLGGKKKKGTTKKDAF